MRYAKFHIENKIHPDILWIAVNIILNPEQRGIYTPIVLALADSAIELLKSRLLYDEGSNKENVPTNVGGTDEN